MKLNFKTLGLAFVAVAAMSSAVAASAQAAQLHVTTAENSAAITGHKEGSVAKFQITPPSGPSWGCSQATFEATVTDEGTSQTQLTTQDVTVTPTYSGCQAFGQAASVRMNGCKYTFTGAGQPANTVTLDIVGCTSGKQIEIQTGICQTTIPTQSNLGHIVFTNVPANPHHVTADLTISGLSYQLHGAVCGHSGTLPTADGVYQEEITFKAFRHVGTQQVTEHSHQFAKVKDDQQVQFGLEST